MLHIESMRIRLPAGYEHRASFIARMVGESLTVFRPYESRKIDSLTIGPIQVMSNSSDMEIANQIAQQITYLLKRET